MGLAERRYQPPPRASGTVGGLTPAVKALLIINVSVYFLDLVLKALFFGDAAPIEPPLRAWGVFTIQSAIFEGRIWEFFSFQFLHGNVFHLLANSIGLFFFGPWMERWWGSRRFIVFYLLAGMGGALFYSALVLTQLIPGGTMSGMVGASAGIYAILVGVAFVAPELRVSLLFPPITLTMRQLAIGVLAFAAGSVILQLGSNIGGEAGHLGGAIVGFIFMRYPRLLKFPQIKRAATPPPRSAAQQAYESKLRPKSRLITRGDAEVDRILEKISRDGFHHLTDAERATLQRAAEHTKRDDD